MNLNDIFQLIWPNRVRRTQMWSRISDEFWWDSGDCSLIILSSTLPWTEERNVCFQGQFDSELVVSQCNVCSVNLYALSQPFQHTVLNNTILIHRSKTLYIHHTSLLISICRCSRSSWFGCVCLYDFNSF